MTRFVALFRGINVGGNQKIPMTELRAVHTALGFKDIATYIQTGNVVFTSDSSDANQLATLIEDACAQQFAFRARVIVRNAEQFETLVANNPFQDQPEKESKWIVVLFLATRPPITAVEDLRQAYSGPEAFHLIGQELFIYYPDGMGRSKLTNALMDKKLQTVGTARNWNTVLKIQDMLAK